MPNLKQIPITQIQNSKRLSWSLAKQRNRLHLFPQVSSSDYHEFAKQCDIIAFDVLVIEY
jgi:hypothetical protein